MMYRIEKTYRWGRHWITDTTELMTWEQAVKYFNTKRSVNTFWCIVNERGECVYQ